MSLLIKNGTIVTASEIFEGDIFAEHETITMIGRSLSGELPKEKLEGATVYDAQGKYLFPGGVDVHTHMDLDVGIARAVDDFHTGTVAAACGGTTSIVDHMAFGPKGCPLHFQLNVYHGLADGHAVVDYGFHGTVQHVDESILDELSTMMDDGVSSAKVYLTYGYKINDDGVLRVLKKMKEIGGVTAFHCENHDVIEYLKAKYGEEGKTKPCYHAMSRPDIAEAEAVRRVLYLARLAGDAPVYIVHLSAKESLEAVRQARAEGQKHIFVETCTQYLTLTDGRYDRPDGLKYIMSPPLRKREDVEALWDGIARGDIQVVATDHCPFNYNKEKQMGREDFRKCPNGAPGVEERMILLYSEGVAKGRISLSRFVDVACTSPAKIYGLAPKKGEFLPGSDADICILDPDVMDEITKEKMHTAADYTAYEGWKVQGRITDVFLRGQHIVQGGVYKGREGDGRFIRRTPLRLKEE